MNKQWSEQNKIMQSQIKKEPTFSDGICTLLDLRKKLFQQLLDFKNTLTNDAFCAIPFINANGYHNKTIAYSIWHIFRIEDIVAHTLICHDTQVFFKKNYQTIIASPIITTGNELVKEQIADFSKQLNLDALYAYIDEVYSGTNTILKSLSYSDTKRKISQVEKNELLELQVVSTDEKAFWLIDYWCRKDVRGLLTMPLSRHWIMHIEAAIRIMNKIH